MVKHLLCKQDIVGSSPIDGSIFEDYDMSMIGMAICYTMTTFFVSLHYYWDNHEEVHYSAFAGIFWPITLFRFLLKGAIAFFKDW